MPFKSARAGGLGGNQKQRSAIRAAKAGTPLTVDYLVVAGGGGGQLAGGGGGGFRTDTLTTLRTEVSYRVTVGAGGSAGGTYTASSPLPTKGGNSTFENITSTGGGRGGQTDTGSQTSANGGAGGSGGGGATEGAFTTTGGSGNEGGFNPVEGYSGGGNGGFTTTQFPAGGGGGAGGAGGSATSATVAGTAGPGASSSITGSSVTYAAGGAGGRLSGSNVAGVSGTANSGNGAGGAQQSGAGASGGSGVVILSIPQMYTATFSVGVTQTSTVSGGRRIYTITAAGASDTVTFA